MVGGIILSLSIHIKWFLFGAHLKLKKLCNGYFFIHFIHENKLKNQNLYPLVGEKHLTTRSLIFLTKGYEFQFFIFLYPLVYQFWKGGLGWLRSRMISSFLVLIFLIFIALRYGHHISVTFWILIRHFFISRVLSRSEIRKKKFDNEMIVKVSKQQKWGKNNKNHHILSLVFNL